MDVNEYNLSKKSSRVFTYRKVPDPRKKGQYLDNGICEICGKRGTYTHVQQDWPTMCYKCHQSLRAYRRLMFDPLKLQKKKKLTVKQCKSVVQYMRKYAKMKAMAAAAITSVVIASNMK